MKSFLFVLVILISGFRLPAQTNPPIRLALISESPEASAAADVLIVQLSSHANLQLLERNEIEKVYREQGLSAGSKDYLKLGQILGADGLLLFNVVKTPQATNLTARLVAVKPGVVLLDENVPWPLRDMAGWSPLFVRRLDPFVPKLSVLVKDAVPISVVNLRSAIASADAAETERQLKLLTIQRLSREPRMFVLERQRMQLLSGEKDLKLDDSAFWSGSYLLDGVVDQNGYSRETITINARLTPPKGGMPLLMAVSGSRTNLAEVINQLAAKVNEALKLNASVKEWNAAEEARQYFEEAQWALRWGIYSEAQMAAESAWALGNRDLECAMVRIRAYISEVPRVAAPNVGYYLNGKRANYVHINEPPDPKHLEVALYALKCYSEFSRTSPEGESKILWRGKGWNDWRNSDWYQLGIDVLDVGSSVLQHFNYAPEAQKPVAEKLAELRALARSIAVLISRSPSVHDSYFVGDRIATRDELSNTIGRHSNIFSSEVNWGCYWQERPEDGIALYRELMSSPVFCYIHNDFWQRSPFQPRLIAWNQADQNRIPQVWADFVRELNASTNVLLRMEAQALAMADAPNKEQAQLAQQEWWTIVRSNRDELVANNVELFYLGWGVAYGPETEALDREYWNKTVPARKTLAAFEKQKEFLTTNQPYDFSKFGDTFREKNYSKGQALEIQPLLAAYKSNLMAQSQTASLRQIGQLRGAISRVGFLEKDVSRILNPPAPAPPPSAPPPPATPVVSQPALTAKGKITNSISSQTPEVVTNVLLVKKFLPIPTDGLPGDNISFVTVTAHHWMEGKLVLDFQYGAFVYSFNANGNWQGTRNTTFSAIAILDPATEGWQVISCPEMDSVSRNRFYHHTTLCRGEVFTSDGGRIKKYDAAKNAWQVLDISDVGNCELFTVNSNLYAATPNLILEILDGGTRTRILASNRRQPPASALDTENLGTPALFAGPNRSLRAAVGNKIVTWDGEDWRPVCPAPQAPSPPMISDDGILFLADGWNAPAGLWHLATDGDHVEFWLGQVARRGAGAARPGSSEDAKPAWKLPPGFSMIGLAATSRGRDLYLLTDHAKSQNIVNEQEHLIIGKKILPQDGYHAGLLCFSGNNPVPQKIFLKFDGDDASLPVAGDNRATGFKVPNVPSSWLLFSTNYLFCGQETIGDISIGASTSAIRTPTGVWLIPLDQIDPELARKRIAQQEKQARSNVLAKRAAQTLLEKYDRNHNGIIDADEKAAALDDPGFIESELDTVDANHNGWLNAAELVYFDANTNKILEPKEQAGIELAQHLLAERSMKKFDASGDDLLDRPEFEDLFQAGMVAGTRSLPGTPFSFLDGSHDNHLDLEELKAFLKQQTRGGLNLRGMSGAAGFDRMRMNANQPVDPGQMFKTAVEFYWQNPGGITNRPPFRPGMPPGAGWIPNGPQGVSTP